MENTMTKFIKQASTYRVAPDDDMIVSNELPAATYTVGATPTGEYFLSVVNDYIPVVKLYGNTESYARRILNTFKERKGASTGVLLAGEKGTGKSLLAKYLSIYGREKGYPTIVINSPWCGENFNKFIQSINQPCVIIFDEFEKVYDNEEGQQDALLTLLDGVYPTTKLFVLTTNSTFRINQHMMNRPGRLFYMIEYKGLEGDFIREYCQDNLKNKTYIENIITYSGAFEAFNFDSLKALVEEMNRYNESPADAAKILNIKAESYVREYIVKVLSKGKEQKLVRAEPIRTDPLKSFNIWYYASKKDCDNGDCSCISLSPSNLTEYTTDACSFSVTDDEGRAVEVYLTAYYQQRKFSYNELALAA